MLAWPVDEILESNGLTHEQLHESITLVAAGEETEDYFLKTPEERKNGIHIIIVYFTSYLVTHSTKLFQDQIFLSPPHECIRIIKADVKSVHNLTQDVHLGYLKGGTDIDCRCTDCWMTYDGRPPQAYAS